MRTNLLCMLTALLAFNLTAAAQPTSGDDGYQFKVKYTSDHLPAEAQAVLVKAHGGFAVDRRPGKGEIYFALPGAGIVKIGADLSTTEMLPTPDVVKNTNMHNCTIWYGADGTGYLTFPANDAGLVLTTTLEGELVHEIRGPRDVDFDEPTVNRYFADNGRFVPTDTEYVDGLIYIATGYSPLDYVLTAKVDPGAPTDPAWHDLAFGGKGGGEGQFGTGHGITVTDGGHRIHVADRPNSEVERFTRYGHYRGKLDLPKGSFPCDIDFHKEFAVVGCLHGPDREKGAPAYLLKSDELISTVMPKEDLGLDQFQHIHNAVLTDVDGTLHIIAQAWNPGDFAILEHVKE